MRTSSSHRLYVPLLTISALLLCSCASGMPSPADPRDLRTSVSTAPPACEQYAASAAPSAPGGEALIEAVGRTELPAGVVLSPGVQVVNSAETAGMYDAIVHVCSMPLTRATLMAIGESVAAAINADPSRSMLSKLTMQSWVQIGTDAAAEDPNTPSISLDFASYAAGLYTAAPQSAWR